MNRITNALLVDEALAYAFRLPMGSRTDTITRLLEYHRTEGRLELTQVVYDALVGSYTLEEGEPWPAAEAVVTALVGPPE